MKMHITWLPLSYVYAYGGILAPAPAVAKNNPEGTRRRSLEDANGGNSSSVEFQTALDDLNGQVSNFGGRVHATNYTDWMRECAYYFKRGGFGQQSLQVKYSTYHMKDKPSGLCNFQLYVDFDVWNDTVQDVLSETDLLSTNFEDIEDQLPPLALPAFMSFPETAKDVSEIVSFANANSLKVSIKNSGHSYTAGSSSKGSLQLNLRKFPKYSFTHVHECEEGREYTPFSGTDGSCKLALARGKTAVVRVGGGQGNDDMYRSVMDWNYMEERTKRYNIVGGAEGMIGGGGGWLLGGGLARGEERLYGCGADQVLELEMIIPDGKHVKFGPTKWEEKEGFEYPQTTMVEGKCNANIHHDESEWEWVECQDGKPFVNVTFEDLWFAVRGGGGGTWGVVLSSIHQLHELIPQFRLRIDPVEPNEDVLTNTCTKLEGNSDCPAYKEMMSYIWMDFIIDLLWNEENKIGVDEELRVRCGFAGPAMGNPLTTLSGYNALNCHGHGIQEKFQKAWRTSVSNSKYILDGYGEEEICAIQNRIFLEGGSYDRWHKDMLVFDPSFSYSPSGKYVDTEGPEGAYVNPLAIWPGAMIPASLLATKSEVVFELLPFLPSGHTLPYSPQNDGMTPFAPVYHSGGLQTYIAPFKSLATAVATGSYDLQNPCVWSEAFISEMEQEVGDRQAWVLSHLGYDGGDFPGYTEYNHMFMTYGGVLKSDPTKPCPLASTREEKKTLCLSAQETVWGTTNFRRLTAIKNMIDPNNVFDVHFGIGNDERAGPIIDYCAKSTDPTAPPLTGPDFSELRASETLVSSQECHTDDNPSDPADGADKTASNDGKLQHAVAYSVSLFVAIVVIFLVS